MSGASLSLKNAKILLASQNKGKLEELKDLMDGKAQELFLASDFDLYDPEETGTTFVENAIIKASECQEQMQAKGHKDIICLADDSGFSVEALGGAPGVYSARWAESESHEGRDFIYAMQKVYDKWQETAPNNSKAAFISVIAVAFPDGSVKTYEGSVDGDIVWPARGKKGFGYDPMFQPEGYDKTFAEMDFTEKQSMSHRARALAKMAEELL